ncbi:MAG: RNA polymerase sigma-54 factor [Clostridia bacterium]|nr:MAG: RNA polymerase sigma-54 factor [Clostridia bacterium]
MRTNYGLNLEQSQRLIMTPELRQAMAVLQLPAMELADYVEQVLRDNPVLEMREDGEDSPAENVPAEEWEWEDYFHDTSDLGYLRPAGESKSGFTLENIVSESPTLHDHLRWQLQVSPCTRFQQAIGEFLIGNIDDNGYLCVSLEEAARILQVNPAQVQKVLALVQNFDPPGVGARNLTECLLLQLERRGAVDLKVKQVISFHLPDLAAGKLNRVAKSLNISLVEAQRIADVIRSLDPKPGRVYGGYQDVRYIVPDVTIEKVEGQYVVTINDGVASRVTISPTYQAILRRGGECECDPQTRKFIESRLEAAAWLIRCIEQRRVTLYRVACCLTELQRDFLDRGVKCLKPLTLKEVAAMLGLHESTVSRATANKYVQTPQGVFELKFFFDSGVKRQANLPDASSESIKRLISELVAAEDQHHPLSDQQLVNLLRQRGIQIARRTVAKYRDQAGIPSAPKRRRY